MRCFIQVRWCIISEAGTFPLLGTRIKRHSHELLMDYCISHEMSFLVDIENILNNIQH